MKRFLWLVLLGVLGAVALFWTVWWWYGGLWRAPDGTVLIPATLRRAVPRQCRQLVVVRPGAVDRVPAEVWLLERGADVSRWKIVAGPLAANVGRNGTAWGRDGSDEPNPGHLPDKKEGDGRSPAGVFAIPAAFGTSPQAPIGVRLPWLECTATLRGVDDVKSKYYNRIVDEAGVPDKDWDSAEVMRREDGLYEIGLVIDHNPDRVPGAGSCIFLHIWKGPGQGTAGCTALAEQDVRQILMWLDPAREPRLVLGVP